jgi:hypothetical protein
MRELASNWTLAVTADPKSSFRRHKQAFAISVELRLEQGTGNFAIVLT